MEDMIFPRGDGVTKGFSMPASSWSAGGRLFFAAKLQFDDDTTDAAALIQGNWGDDVVTDVVRDGVAYKRYACDFPPEATADIVSNGAAVVDLLGEFQFVPVGGRPVTMPAEESGDKIPVKVLIDIKLGTTV